MMGKDRERPIDRRKNWEELIQALLPRYITIPLGEEPIVLNRKEYIALIGLGILCLIGIGLAVNHYSMKRIARKELFEAE